MSAGFVFSLERSNTAPFFVPNNFKGFGTIYPSNLVGIA